MVARQVASGLARLRLPGLDRARGERVEHVLDDVLGRQPLDQLGLHQPDGGLVRDGAEQLSVLVGELAVAGEAADHPELLVARHQGDRKHRLVAGLGPPLRIGGAGTVATLPARPAHQVEDQPGSAPSRARGGSVRGVGADENQLVGVHVEAVDLTGVRAQQLASAAGHGLVEVLAHGDLRERLAQLGQRGQGLDPAPGVLVELGVLDRPGHQRRRVDEEVEGVVLELPWRLGVQDDDANHVAGLGEDRHRDHRLEVLLLELGNELHPRVGHRVLANELRGLVARHPAREPLVDAERELADETRVTRRCGPQHQPLALGEVDEAGMARGRVGRDVDDPVQDPIEVQRRGDGLDDRVERLVLEPSPTEGVVLLDKLQTQTRPPVARGT